MKIDILKRLADICNHGIIILFGLMMTGILLATLLIDKNIDTSFPNTVRYANGGYYLFAFLLFLCFIGYMLRFEEHIKNETFFYGALGIIGGITFVIQILVVSWVPIYLSGGDFATVRNMAVSLSSGGGMEGVAYFQTNPNNVNITLLFSWVYSLLGSWRAIVLVGALLTNLSVILAALTIYQCTQNKSVCLLMAGCGEILIALTWRAYIPYTDNWGMFFVTLTFWLYTTHVKKRYKIPFLFIVGAVGCFIKATAIIPLLAVVIHAFLQWLVSDNMRIAWKKIVAVCLCFGLVFGSIKIVEKQLYHYYRYTVSEGAKGWQSFFMMGQNSNSYGAINSEDGSIRKAFYAEYGTYKETMKACFSEGLKRIQSRKLLGNIKFYIKKLNLNYNDGYFHNIQDYSDEEIENNFWYNLYLKKGAYYDIGANIEQVLWDFLLLVMAMGVMIGRQEQKDIFFKILILGITAYVLLFEGRSKYLYMFLPVYMAYAGIIMNHILNNIIKVQTAIKLMDQETIKDG